VILVEVTRKAYLASIVPVIVNAILNEHQLVVDIIAFVSKGDFPRSRLGEKQRGKILASWVTRKMRTMAQFGIRDVDGAFEGSILEEGPPSTGLSARTGVSNSNSRNSQNQHTPASTLGENAVTHIEGGEKQEAAFNEPFAETYQLPEGIVEMPAYAQSVNESSHSQTSGGASSTARGSENTTHQRVSELDNGSEDDGLGRFNESTGRFETMTSGPVDPHMYTPYSAEAADRQEHLNDHTANHLADDEEELEPPPPRRLGVRNESPSSTGTAVHQRDVSPAGPPPNARLPPPPTVRLPSVTGRESLLFDDSAHGGAYATLPSQRGMLGDRLASGGSRLGPGQAQEDDSDEDGDWPTEAIMHMNLSSQPSSRRTSGLNEGPERPPKML
jgi:hypothetical protein